MKRMDHNEMIAAIQGDKEGKQLQYSMPGAEWRDVAGFSLFDFASYRYRVKPEPPMEWWLGTCQVNTTPTWKVWDDKPPLGCPQCEIVRVREVLEENTES